ncbi:hypothetical protein ACFCV3_00940 [Kribbella sp. NPDC056345]|uniref:hypothetical protein n=1 Tax=Kribbella sp. NPDC056345 TaxID=3345789 RepID=UPI0035DAC9E2
MDRETWLEPKSKYMANGWVDFAGKMTEAEITDGHGFLKDRDRTFESKEEFFTYAKDAAGILW